ncbi:polymer-forming cytoskeletal protein [Halonotius roseus]|uniref:Acyltransferase n=1 Tax=Halonotius roseus TaxID=2511997 RepID=A0A544QKQ8_9EURY|nr:polymer-forming cytoskeletal protein [Halonotius roseus]TQQ78952.1 acyltransferase [Halonotius roseus]
MNPPQNPIDELQIPDGTTVEEHDVVTDGDILIGSNSTVDFGLRGRTIAAGERVEFGRQIEADGDCRLDMWCTTDGSVLAGEDAYIGERVEINGQLLVSGDLDIGDDVTIEEGFEANGWIVTRNPVPVLVFYFIVLSQFLRRGDTDKADEFASALAGEGIEDRSPLVVPRGAEISDDAWRVSTPARIGDNCRIHGNIRAESITLGEGTTVFGSLRARDDIEVGAGTVIIGDVTTRGGTITLARGAHVRGDVACDDLVVNEGAEVDGTLRARGEMKLIRRTDDEEDDADADTAAESDVVDDSASADADTVEPETADADGTDSGPKMAYTAGNDAAEADSAADTDATATADADGADEQPTANASDPVGAAYTVGDDVDSESDAEPDADTDDQRSEPDSETAKTVGSHYLAGNGDAADDTPESEAAADDADSDDADTAAADADDTDDGAVIITDAESDDIALESDGDRGDPDSASDS